MIIPLACAGVLLNAAVFHTAVRHFETQLTDSARASYNYLWLSVVLGIALPSWLFWESDFAAWWLVLIGMPGGVGIGTVLARASCRVIRQGRASTLLNDSLWEPLLEVKDRDTEPVHGRC